MNQEKSKLKLCFLADPNHVNTRNWVEYFAETLGHEVHLVSLNDVTLPPRGVILHHVDVPFSRSKIKYLSSIPEVRRIIREINPDILIGYRIVSYGFLAAATGFHPLVLAAQGQNIVYPNYSIPLLLAAKFALKRADLINSWADHMAKKMVSLGADPAKILILPRGVDTALFKPCGRFLENAIPRIISTRSLRPEPHYNIEPIIRAVQNLIPKFSKIEYWVVGDGPRKSAMMEFVVNLKLTEHVRFVGSVSNSELPKILQSCHIYISNVWSDGVSSSLLEAMACGIFPIVVNNVSNQSWIVNGKNGFLVTPDDHESLAQAITKALEDEELRKMAAQINRKIVMEGADWIINMAKIESVYFQLLKHKG